MPAHVPSSSYPNRRARRGLAAAGLVAALALVLGSCQIQPQPPNLKGCTRIYQPVCGSKNGTRQTFSNICVAESEEAKGITPGECRR